MPEVIRGGGGGLKKLKNIKKSPIIHTFIYSVVRSFIHPLINHLFIPPSIHQFIYSFILLINPFIYLFISSLIHTPIHSYTHSFIRTSTHPSSYLFVRISTILWVSSAKHTSASIRKLLELLQNK